VKLAVVVQRYGAQINGGAELHARYIVELLARQHQVDVLTTCARDYVTWRDEYPEGTEAVRGVKVRRFRVSRERDVEDFGRRSTHVFEHRHSIADEIAWLDSEGPTSPALIEYVRAHANDYDYIFFFSYRYYHAYHGVRAVPGKAILVPTAERDATIGLHVFGPIFRGVRAIMYNSHEERAMIQAATKNTHVPGVVVGIGSEVPRNPVASRFRRKYNIHDPFIIYVGRIDENKGCRELFTNFTSYRPRLGQRLKLVLIGNSILPIPDHPNVHHLGFVSDQDKFDAIAAADALIMPSFYESLSMVALEAWALGRPVLANGRCDVLRGQCIRSRAGLYYDTFEEFAETLFTLTSNRDLAEGLGDNGRHYFETHYAWSVIERKYSDILRQLAQEDASGTRKAAAVEPLPGWLTRRRKTLPPAADVLKELPRGAAAAGAGAGSGSGGHGGGSGTGSGAGSSSSGGSGSSATAAGDALSGESGADAHAPLSLEPSRAGSHATMARPEGGGGNFESRRGEGRTDGGRREGRGGDRGGRSDRGDRGERGDRGARSDRGDRGDRGEGDRGERGERREGGERGERGGDRADSGDRAARGERGERGERSDRGERGARGDRSTRGDRGERGEREESGDRGDRADREGRAEGGDRGEPGERGDRSARGDRGERGGDRGERGERGDRSRHEGRRGSRDSRDRNRQRDGNRDRSRDGAREGGVRQAGEGGRSEGRSGEGGNGRDQERRDSAQNDADRRDDRRDADRGDGERRDAESHESGSREGSSREGGPREGGAREGGAREGGTREGGPSEGGTREGTPREGGDQREGSRREGDRDRGPRPPRREGGGGGGQRRRPRDGRSSGSRGGR
jgi:glycosyltransferase involved in cell wall biosynthesis